MISSNRAFVLSWSSRLQGLNYRAAFAGVASLLALGTLSPLLADTPGKDGAYTPAAGTHVVNSYSTIPGALAIGATTITVRAITDLNCSATGSCAANALGAGDLIMIYEAQGATIGTADDATYGAVTALNSAGRYEFQTVASVAGNVITITTGCGNGLRFAYDAGRAQVIRVPQFLGVTLGAGAVIRARAWDGKFGTQAVATTNTGGVLAMTVLGNVTMSGDASINVDGQGFAGAPTSNTTPIIPTAALQIAYRTQFQGTTATRFAGQKGEGIASHTLTDTATAATWSSGRGAPANGGGGGDNHNAGGGGGANEGVTVNWNNGRGVRPAAGVNDLLSWALDPENDANWSNSTLGAGGGRGGYSWVAVAGNPTTTGPGAGCASQTSCNAGTWGGDGRRQVGGRGGHPLQNSPAAASASLFFGGGGGAGDANNSVGGAGGNGGGLIVMVVSNGITATGTSSISANGRQGGDTTGIGNDAAGGAGAGGSLVIQAAAINGLPFSAVGGRGGNHVNTNSEVEGTGGGGGGGFIATGGTLTGGSRTVAGGANGTTTQNPVMLNPNFPPEGATTGAPGGVTTFTGGALPICTTLPVSVSWFHGTRGRRGVAIEWETSAEAGNVGFNLYGEVDGERVPVNDALIPSKAVSTLQPSQYAMEVQTDATVLWLEEVDLVGQTRLHGPFALEAEHGQKEALEPVAWAAVRQESDAKESERVREAVDGEPGGRRMSSLSAPVPPPAARLLVSADGMARVTYEALKAAGFDWAGVQTKALSLSNRGRSVPIQVTGPSRTGILFGPGSAIVFWGERIKSLYTDVNVYRLSADSSGKTSRINLDGESVDLATPPSASYRETTTVDRNVSYSFASPSGDPWFEQQILAYTSPVQGTFGIDVRDLDSAGGGQLTIGLWGSTDWPASPDHHVLIRWNGNPVGEAWFDGIVDQPIQVALSAGQIREGRNDVEVVVPGDSGVAYELVVVDKYSVSYPRAYRALEDRLSFTGGGGPYAVDGLGSGEAFVFWKTANSDEVTLGLASVVEPSGTGYRVRFGKAQERTKRQYRVTTSAGFLAPRIEPARPATDLLAGTPARMLIVSHPDFLAGIEPLAAARRSSGVSVRVVDVRDVYESYSGGIVDPSAIRELVREAYQRWKTRSVLLVGGDTYDYFNYLGLGSKSFVPTLYAQTDPVVVRYAPADPLYGDVNGDGVPEVSVGRFPARTSAELSLLVRKTLDYRGGSGVLLAADAIDPSLSFKAVSDTIVAALPTGTQASRAYVDDLGIQGARTALLGTMNAGGGLVSYLGHSSPTRWSFQSLFTTADAAALTNSTNPLVVMQFGCWNNYFVEPAHNTLGHILTVGGGQGAAAALGISTLSDAGSDAVLGPALVPRLLQKGMTVGRAILDAKSEIARDGQSRPDIQLGMTLLGDPEIVINP